MNQNSGSIYLVVAVNAPLKEPLTYLPPEQSLPNNPIGLRVKVPLGKRQLDGVIIGTTKDKGNYKLKPISSLQEDFPPLSSVHISWLTWVSNYYLYPIGQTCHLSFPPLKKGTLRNKTRKSPIIKTTEGVECSSEKNPVIPKLTGEQQKVTNDMAQSLNKFNVHLVHGVTGSGKTEVYLNLLEKTLSQGKKGLVLVPEISLTPQLVQRFHARFGQQIAVIHSHLTPREKTNQWWEIVDNKKNILIGARSALFCPIASLGIIIIDEEHEPSFKQNEKLKYHARDAAVVIAKKLNCPIVLGSATPSLESWQNSKKGIYQLHSMEKRVNNRPMPKIEIIPMRKNEEDNQTSKEEELPFWLSHQLYQALKENLKQNKQSALFLNRRGVAQVVHCKDCGYVYECPDCAVSLTLHSRSNLICHYCGYHDSLHENCPDCKEGELQPLGTGTELIEKNIQTLFPTARISRADRDEINSREDMERFIQEVENKDVDIIIGTQMIAKGLDFPDLTLVGVVLADVGFNLPDFRAAERSFQLICQVSGRAGRHIQKNELPGKVIVQTYNPSHPCLKHALLHDFKGFAQEELSNRDELKYPPFEKICSIRIQGLHMDKVKTSLKKLSSRIQILKDKYPQFASITVLGPVEAPLARLRGQHRFHLLTKSSSSQTLRTFCSQVLSDGKWIESTTKVMIDVDPISFL